MPITHIFVLRPAAGPTYLTKSFEIPACQPTFLNPAIWDDDMTMVLGTLSPRDPISSGPYQLGHLSASQDADDDMTMTMRLGTLSPRSR